MTTDQTPEQPTNNEPADNEAAPDPFDMDALRQAQDFHSGTGVTKTPKAKVRKPAKEWWFQVHPEPEFRTEGYVIELKEDREIYWIAPHMWEEVISEPTCGRRAIFTYVTRQSQLYLWPIRLPDADGKLDDWNQSALDYARQGGIWQRVASNMHVGEYDQFTTSAQWPDPQWPDLSLKEILAIAFKGKIIDRPDHPVLQKLRGE